MFFEKKASGTFGLKMPLGAACAKIFPI